MVIDSHADTQPGECRRHLEACLAAPISLPCLSNPSVCRCSLNLRMPAGRKYRNSTRHTRAHAGELCRSILKRCCFSVKQSGCLFPGRDDILSVLCQSALVVEIRMMRADIQRARFLAFPLSSHPVRAIVIHRASPNSGLALVSMPTFASHPKPLLPCHTPSAWKDTSPLCA